MTKASGNGFPASGSLGRRLASGTAFLAISVVVTRAIGLVNLLILARLLSPAQFGLVGMALIVLELVTMASDIQVANGLLRSPNWDRGLFDTAFTLNFLRGLLAAGFLGALAWPASLFYEQPAVLPILLAMAAIPILEGLRSPRFVEYARDLEFRPDLIVNLVSRLVGMAVAIAIAIVFQSLWAIVAGQLTVSLVGAFATHIAKPYRMKFSLNDFRSLLAFGAWITVAGVLNYFAVKIGPLVIGASFDAATFGLVNLALQIATLGIVQLAEPFKKSMFAGLAGITGDIERQRLLYARGQSMLLGLILPLGVGISLTAREIVLASAGERWLGAVEALAILSPALAVGTLGAGAQALKMAQGETRAIMRCMVRFLFLAIVFVLVGSALGGLRGIVVAMAAGSAAYAGLALDMAGTGVREICRMSWRIPFGIAAMILTVQLVDPVLADIRPAVSVFVIKAFLGAAIYVVAVSTLWLLAGRPDGFERSLLALWPGSGAQGG